MQKEKAIKILKNGEIIIFPTDTAYGIGCLMENSRAVRKVYKLRNRPKEKAVPVLFSSIGMVKKYVKPLSQDVKLLMKKYWPGGLTIILNCKTSKVPNSVRAGKNTIGVRIPNHKILLDIIRKTGPIIAPSANFSGEKTPYLYSNINKKIASKVDFVFKGRTRSTSSGQALRKSSTVIDCTKKPFKIIREGAAIISF